MVFVKVRETYDLHTLQNKMTVIGIHTPKQGIIKANYPGLLMQCKQYRPVSCDVRMACASMLPLDPLGIGTTEGDVAPEDVFNPILYKAVSNQSMTQIETLIHLLGGTFAGTPTSTDGQSVIATNDGITSDDFAIYYGLLSDTHGWKHASPQAGMSMTGLVPLVYEALYNIGQNVPSQNADGTENTNLRAGATGINANNSGATVSIGNPMRGRPHPIPFMNCTAPIFAGSGSTGTLYATDPGFVNMPDNSQQGVPAPRVMCGCIIVPPSRLHQLFFRLVCEWTLEFTGIRPLSDLLAFNGLSVVGALTHYQDYDFGESKLLTESTELVDTTDGSAIKKVM